MRSTILIVLLALLVAPAAEARKRPHRMSFDFAVTVAVAYWTKHNVAVPCHPTRRLLSTEEAHALDAAFGYGIDMAADRPACTVLITPAAEYYRTDRESALQWLYCTDVVHELGHLAGLGHDAGGIMDPDRRGTDVPWGCAHPARFKRERSFRRDGAGVAQSRQPPTVPPASR